MIKKKYLTIVIVLSLLFSTFQMIENEEQIWNHDLENQIIPLNSADDPITIIGESALELYCDLYCDPSQNGTIENPYIFENLTINASRGIGIEISDITSFLIIKNCSIFNGTEGIFLNNCQNVNITNNNIYTNDIGVNIEQSTQIVIENNNCTENNDQGIKLSDSLNNILINNNCSNNLYGIDINNSNHTTILSNDCINNIMGIRLEESQDCTIEDNICQKTTGNYAIYIKKSSNNTLLANNVLNNDVYGLSLSNGSNNNTITQNNCSNNGHLGIQLSYSNNNTLTENNCLNNTNYGIYLNNANDNNLSSNIMTHSGIFFEFSPYNYQIYNIIDETNTLNGKPIRFYYNQVGLSISDNAAQVILVNCNDSKIENLELSIGWTSILLLKSSNNTILNNNCSNIWSGIVLFLSDNNTLIGNNCFNNQYCGIDIEESNNIALIQNNCSNNQYGIKLEQSHNNTLTANICYNNSNAGICLDYETSNNIFSNNEMTRSGFIFRGSFIADMYDYLSNANNQFGITNEINGKPILYYENRVNLMISGDIGQLILLNCNYSLFENIYNQDLVGTCILLMKSNHNSIIGNNFSRNFYLAGNYNSGIKILLYNSKNNTIKKNDCSFASRGTYLVGSDNNTIEENFYKNNTYSGIDLQNSDNNIIKRNIISGNQYYGIELYDWSDENLILENLCFHNQNGIYVSWYSSSNIIENNNCSWNEDYGIRLYRDSYFNVLRENLCTHNNFGVYLGVVEENVISANNCSYNNVGVYLLSANNNQIYENLFQKNLDHVICNHDLTNSWSFGSRGNFWDNYTGVDEDHDGIGDISYIIPGDTNNDDYPLILLNPIWIEPLSDQIINFGENFSYDINATDILSEIDRYWINDTFHFDISSSGMITTNFPLVIGDYIIEVNVNNTHGNVLTGIFILHVLPINTNEIWQSIHAGINHVVCIISLEQIMISLILRASSETEIKLSYNIENPTNINWDDSMVTINPIGFYAIEFLDYSVIESIEINFFYIANENENFVPSQIENEILGDYLKLYYADSEWVISHSFSSILDIENNKFTFFLDQDNLEQTMQFCIGFNEKGYMDQERTENSKEPFNIPGYPIYFLGFFMIIIISVAIMLQQKKKKT